MTIKPLNAPSQDTLSIEREAYRIKFYLLAHVGGLMILMSSIHPFFPANQIPAIFILAASVVYDHRKNASKLQKRIMAWGSLACALWIGTNSLNRWYVPRELTDTTSTLLPTFITAEQTLTFGYIGHIIVIIGVIQAFRDIRRS